MFLLLFILAALVALGVDVVAIYDSYAGFYLGPIVLASCIVLSFIATKLVRSRIRSFPINRLTERNGE
jgi:hypothetical protein